MYVLVCYSDGIIGNDDSPSIQWLPLKSAPTPQQNTSAELLPGLLSSSWYSASVLSWNYLSKIQNTPLSAVHPSWLLRSRQAGLMFSWLVPVSPLIAWGSCVAG